jgi:hypothetical protein
MHTEALTKDGLELFPALAAFEDFYLAGGTALALQIGHRLSIDFDLFCGSPIDRSMLPFVKKVFAEFPVKPVIKNPDELTAFVGTVKTTFLTYPFPVIDPLVSGAVRMLSVKEIARRRRTRSGGGEPIRTTSIYIS